MGIRVGFSRSVVLLPSSCYCFVFLTLPSSTKNGDFIARSERPERVASVAMYINGRNQRCRFSRSKASSPRPNPYPTENRCEIVPTTGSAVIMRFCLHFEPRNSTLRCSSLSSHQRVTTHDDTRLETR